jgi:hypothetical protein
METVIVWCKNRVFEFVKSAVLLDHNRHYTHTHRHLEQALILNTGLDDG